MSAAVTVVGAGPAGLAAAIGLAKGGRDVELHEWHRHVGARFHGDFQGLENWSCDEDTLCELQSWGIDINFLAHPVRTGTGFDARGRRHEITAGRLYLAHFLGPSGADVALRADPAATVLAVMGAGVVNANPFLHGKTIRDLTDWADRKMNSAPARSSVVTAPRVVPAAVTAFKEAVDKFWEAL